MNEATYLSEKEMYGLNLLLKCCKSVKHKWCKWKLCCEKLNIYWIYIYFFFCRRPKRNVKKRLLRDAVSPHWEPPHPSQSLARSETCLTNKTFLWTFYILSCFFIAPLKWCFWVEFYDWSNYLGLSTSYCAILTCEKCN